MKESAIDLYEAFVGIPFANPVTISNALFNLLGGNNGKTRQNLMICGHVDLSYSVP